MAASFFLQIVSNFTAHKINEMNRTFFPILLILFLLSACKVNHLSEIQPQAYHMTREATTSDTAIDSLIAPYKAKLDAEMNQVIGTAEITLSKDKPESTFGNWMSDLLYEQINAHTGVEIDFASVNYGGIRIPTIQQGDVTRGKIYELMPFDNMVTVLYVDATTLRQFLDKIATSGGIPVSKQLRLAIRNGKPENITIKGKPIQDGKIYKIGVSDYVANGGDDCSFFVNQKREELGIFLRDVIIEYVEKQTAYGKNLTAELDGRITINN